MKFTNPYTTRAFNAATEPPVRAGVYLCKADWSANYFWRYFDGEKWHIGKVAIEGCGAPDESQLYSRIKLDNKTLDFVWYGVTEDFAAIFASGFPYMPQRYPREEDVPFSVVAKAYARANRLIISTVNARTTRYGFSDLKTGKQVLFSWPCGVCSYKALYLSMKRYVATGVVW